MSLKQRLERLQRHYAPEHVLGVQIGDGPVTVAGEEMTPETFHKQYPGGDILHIVFVNHRPEDKAE